ncbi:hypothetical protein PHYPSEUDO_010532 [Phytophthora pseudosyringae]|uniref:Uncharacterized protein n=1 Tax=Phytophthora pseudosyringae TaxID=221518 RepID=A0A8T1VA12_9STRA|nr:hypothetical protein PHYPSEUDO_010532 [Phytophthora pseudosyringae]
MTSLDSRCRSLSEGCRLNLVASCVAFSLPPVDDHHPLVLAVRHGGESFAALEQRSKSESFICTAQGVVFQDTKSQKCQARLNSLVALAASSSSSQSNVLLAKKALRYRKVLERRRAMA